MSKAIGDNAAKNEDEKQTNIMVCLRRADGSSVTAVAHYSHEADQTGEVQLNDEVLFTNADNSVTYDIADFQSVTIGSCSINEHLIKVGISGECPQEFKTPANNQTTRIQYPTEPTIAASIEAAEQWLATFNRNTTPVQSVAGGNFQIVDFDTGAGNSPQLVTGWMLLSEETVFRVSTGFEGSIIMDVSSDCGLSFTRPLAFYSATPTSQVLPDFTLPAGMYYFQLWAIDNLGNTQGWSVRTSAVGVTPDFNHDTITFSSDGPALTADVYGQYFYVKYDGAEYRELRTNDIIDMDCVSVCPELDALDRIKNVMRYTGDIEYTVPPSAVIGCAYALMDCDGFVTYFDRTTNQPLPDGFVVYKDQDYASHVVENRYKTSTFTVDIFDRPLSVTIAFSDGSNIEFEQQATNTQAEQAAAWATAIEAQLTEGIVSSEGNTVTISNCLGFPCPTRVSVQSEDIAPFNGFLQFGTNSGSVNVDGDGTHQSTPLIGGGAVEFETQTETPFGAGQLQANSFFIGGNTAQLITIRVPSSTTSVGLVMRDQDSGEIATNFNPPVTSVSGGLVLLPDGSTNGTGNNLVGETNWNPLNGVTEITFNSPETGGGGIFVNGVNIEVEGEQGVAEDYAVTSGNGPTQRYTICINCDDPTDVNWFDGNGDAVDNPPDCYAALGTFNLLEALEVNRSPIDTACYRDSVGNLYKRITIADGSTLTVDASGQFVEFDSTWTQAACPTGRVVTTRCYEGTGDLEVVGDLDAAGNADFELQRVDPIWTETIFNPTSEAVTITHVAIGTGELGDNGASGQIESQLTIGTVQSGIVSVNNSPDFVQIIYVLDEPLTIQAGESLPFQLETTNAVGTSNTPIYISIADTESTGPTPWFPNHSFAGVAVSLYQAAVVRYTVKTLDDGTVEAFDSLGNPVDFDTTWVLVECPDDQLECLEEQKTILTTQERHLNELVIASRPDTLCKDLEKAQLRVNQVGAVDAGQFINGYFGTTLMGSTNYHASFDPTVVGTQELLWEPTTAGETIILYVVSTLLDPAGNEGNARIGKAQWLFTCQADGSISISAQARGTIPLANADTEVYNRTYNSFANSGAGFPDEQLIVDTGIAVFSFAQQTATKLPTGLYQLPDGSTLTYEEALADGWQVKTGTTTQTEETIVARMRAVQGSGTDTIAPVAVGVVRSAAVTVQQGSAVVTLPSGDTFQALQGVHTWEAKESQVLDGLPSVTGSVGGSLFEITWEEV